MSSIAVVGQAPDVGSPSAHDNPQTRQRILERRERERSSRPQRLLRMLCPITVSAWSRHSIIVGCPWTLQPWDYLAAVFCQMPRLTTRRNMPASTASHDPSSLSIDIYHALPESLGLWVLTRDWVSAGIAQRNGHTPLSHWLLGCHHQGEALGASLWFRGSTGKIVERSSVC